MDISPAFLEFKPPFTKTSTEILTLTNNTKQPLAFKVKTTAPRLYCVRPNASTVNVGESLDVQIILQGLKEEPEAGYKCKDKFLIVSLPCPTGLQDDKTTVAKMWPELEAKFKAESSSKKIRVIFKTGSSGSQPVEASTPIANKSSKSGAAAAAAAGVAAAGATIANKPSVLSIPEDTTMNDSIYTSSSSPKAKGTTAESRDLSESQKDISDIKEKLDTHAKAATSTEVAPAQSSIPVPVIALSAILFFIIAWLFF